MLFIKTEFMRYAMPSRQSLNKDKRLVGVVSLGDIAVHVADRDLAGETLQEISEPSQPKR